VQREHDGGSLFDPSHLFVFNDGNGMLFLLFTAGGMSVIFGFRTDETVQYRNESQLSFGENQSVVSGTSNHEPYSGSDGGGAE
jgi:hypothetical protein